jgi:hypothetical protein
MNFSDQYSWIKEVDYMKCLDDDSKLIVQELGIETYLKLFSIFSKSRIYFSNNFFYDCKREFIRNNIEKYSVRQLTKMLNVSEQFVQRTLKEETN